MGQDYTSHSRAQELVDQGRYAEALPIYENLAKAGDAQSQTFLGWMYYEGLGVAKNREQAIAWFERAAALGSKEGAFYCGRAAAAAGRYDEAAKWFHVSAQKEYSPALLWLGVIYSRGLGRPSDLAKGLDYLERAAELGNFLARREIALLTVRGRLGVVKIPLGIILLVNSVISGIVAAISGNRSEQLMG